MERTTVRLPSELLNRARKKAAKEGRTLTSLIEEGLRAVVSRQPRPNPKREVVLPVSSATGGLMPGFEWERLATQVQELEDIEYIERLKNGFK